MGAAFHQEINYLRLSITDRCNLRCVYCTYWQEWEKLPAGEILRYEELLRIVAVGAGIGLRKVRVTGGEPLLRRGVVQFIDGLQRIPGIQEVCLTTNGLGLVELAPALYETGLRHLNLSLDTLRPDRYLKITGRDGWRKVRAGLEAALSLGFSPVKLNCVVLKGLNDDELVDLALLARDHPLQVRFIELMPTTSRDWWERHFLPMAEVRRRLTALGPLAPVTPPATAGPARIFRVPGFQGELGFITPLTDHHCGACNRLRLTAAGQLRPCLSEALELDLKGPLRQGAADGSLSHLFHAAIGLKSGRSGIPAADTPACSRAMVSIGG